jgi:hypothetical protein
MLARVAETQGHASTIIAITSYERTIKKATHDVTREWLYDGSLSDFLIDPINPIVLLLFENRL